MISSNKPLRTTEYSYAPAGIRPLISTCIKRIATGPRLSKNLALADAEGAMNEILEQRTHPVQAAVFLIALRMKRESMEENRGILSSIREHTAAATLDIDHLCDIADPYDGTLRQAPDTAFLPAVLAACGYPTFIHGVSRVGPKYGLTHRRVLQAAGIDVDRTPDACAQRIADPKVGWAYVDQSRYCPALYGLIELRDLLEKRTCVTTCERLAGAVRGHHNHIFLGFVHNDYRSVYQELAEYAGYDSALIVRGSEGTIIPTLNKAVECVSYRRKFPATSWSVDPDDYGIGAIDHQNYHPESPTPSSSNCALEAARSGVAALRGEQNLCYARIVYSAATCLRHLEPSIAPDQAVERVRREIDCGDAWCRFAAHFSRRGFISGHAAPHTLPPSPSRHSN